MWLPFGIIYRDCQREQTGNSPTKSAIGSDRMNIYIEGNYEKSTNLFLLTFAPKAIITNFTIEYIFAAFCTTAIHIVHMGLKPEKKKQNQSNMHKKCAIFPNEFVYIPMNFAMN